MRRLPQPCWSRSPPAPSWPAAGRQGSSAAANANAAVKVSGTFDKTPSVTIPARSQHNCHQHADQGHRSALQSGDAALANVAVYKWSGTTHTLLDRPSPSGPQMIPAQMGLPGLATALKGAHIGSRIVAVLPPKYGYGTSGQAQLQITGNDTLVWVIDLLQQYTATQSATGLAGHQPAAASCRP